MQIRLKILGSCSRPQPVKTAKCDVSCNKIDDLKTDVKKPRPTCEHHKEKKCDCKYCGVFGTVTFT